MAASAACRRGGFALVTFARGFFFSGALGFAAVLGTQASHLRRLTEQQSRQNRGRRQQNTEIKELSARIDQLEDDLGFVSLVLASVMARLDEKGTLTRADVRAAMQELDEIDGVADGRLDINVLRGMQR